MPGKIRHLTSTQLKQRLDQGESFTLLDVREQEEVDFCRIQNAVHMPMNTIPDRLEEIRAYQPVVIYCHHGIRSVQVCSFLKQNGFDNIYNLVGGIEDWALSVDPRVPRY